MNQQTLQVKGMHCASCSAIISRKLKKLSGVASCDVNFATEKATVAFDPQKVTIDTMNNEINKLGYSLVSQEAAHNNTMHHTNMQEMDHSAMSGMDHSAHLGLNQTKEEKLKELEQLRSKVEFSLPITLTLFVLMMWDIFAKIFSFVPNLPIPMALLNTVSFLLATVSLFWIGKPYLIAVLRFFQYKVANMDSLVGIGTLTAYIYSSLIFLIPPLRDLLRLPDYTYFDVTIVVIGFITLGKYLETRSKLKTGEAIEKLLNLQAKTALVIRNKKEIEVPLSEVVVGDMISVKPGAKVPVDGVIVEGSSAIDESMINGEPLPVDKETGDIVIGATMNKQGSFTYKATKVGSDTMLAQIVHMVEQAQGSKASIQNLADAISAVFIPSVLVIALVSLLLWLTVGTYFLGATSAISYGLLAFVGILVIACPCALGLATPTAIIVGVGKGAQHGILIKNAESLEKLRNITTIVFDKTGTITSGKPTVTDVIEIQKANIKDQNHSLKFKNSILQIAASLESHSQHPLAQAILEMAKKMRVDVLHVEKFKETEGMGVEGVIQKQTVKVRKPQKDEHLDAIVLLQEQGKTVVLVEVNKKVVGAIAISDTIKEHAKKTISSLKNMGLKTVMLTGDNKRAASYVAEQVGLDDVKAEVLPQEKSTVIQGLQKAGHSVAMVGDGINDAPSLTQAEVGIAMATGSDIAIESADITLLGGDLSKIAQAIHLSRATMRTIQMNLFWAFIYNIIGIPLAAGAFYPVFGIFLNPIFAGLAMGLSSVSVVTNSLLLKKMSL